MTPLSSAFQMKCSSCRHFDGESDELSREGDGQCRESSPTTQLILTPAQHPISGQTMMVPKQYSLFPRVSAEGCYCSKWARKVSTLVNQ